MPEIRILCLETSSQICSVAIYNNGHLTEVKSDKIQNHAEVLMGMINQCCQEAGIKLSELNALAISDGPGSYTGLRIGSSTAKGICFALNIPLIAVSTLKALAWDAARKQAADLYWPMIDARRMEVYHCLFDKELKMLGTVANGIVTEPEFMPGLISGQTILICGDGAKKTEGILGFPIYNQFPEAGFLTELALESYNKKEFVNLSTYEPFYLKGANITR
jgi:tRNA threonylcarbamoyladenosine biosynthesis protein TsaB